MERDVRGNKENGYVRQKKSLHLLYEKNSEFIVGGLGDFLRGVLAAENLVQSFYGLMRIANFAVDCADVDSEFTENPNNDRENNHHNNVLKKRLEVKLLGHLRVK